MRYLPIIRHCDDSCQCWLRLFLYWWTNATAKKTPSAGSPPQRAASPERTLLLVSLSALAGRLVGLAYCPSQNSKNLLPKFVFRAPCSHTWQSSWPCCAGKCVKTRGGKRLIPTEACAESKAEFSRARLSCLLVIQTNEPR